ncbi:uncharacterized protein ASCRUDRAFT_73626 [Ascoidea rubescens DSM 1968]|uniref:CST complex subunit Stn1 N-terminal domain-containing protein n=1 Tax=Ascoidea rubescens DSM 1968 TaxID=1344418 RepID=A0A1D2VQM6_9ASCO|nr:hypothetical protein ASCRUDRAFT_73626 [Ascoidea rubescens DSM 1968]ODV63867.1 hypothetical protein ASCRUDRAFT_73626 [Ascoidea rubescens DSM 1968]
MFGTPKDGGIHKKRPAKKPIDPGLKTSKGRAKIFDFSAPRNSCVFQRIKRKNFYRPELFYSSPFYKKIVPLFLKDLKNSVSILDVYGNVGLKWHNNNYVLVNNYPIQNVEIFAQVVDIQFRDLKSKYSKFNDNKTSNNSYTVDNLYFIDIDDSSGCNNLTTCTMKESLYVSSILENKSEIFRNCKSPANPNSSYLLIGNYIKIHGNVNNKFRKKNRAIEISIQKFFLFSKSLNDKSHSKVEISLEKELKFWAKTLNVRDSILSQPWDVNKKYNLNCLIDNDDVPSNTTENLNSKNINQCQYKDDSSNRSSESEDDDIVFIGQNEINTDQHINQIFQDKNYILDYSDFLDIISLPNTYLHSSLLSSKNLISVLLLNNDSIINITNYQYEVLKYLIIIITNLSLEKMQNKKTNMGYDICTNNKNMQENHTNNQLIFLEDAYGDMVLSNFLDLLTLRLNLKAFLSPSNDLMLNSSLFDDTMFLDLKGDLFNKYLEFFVNNKLISFSKIRINLNEKPIIRYENLLHIYNKLLLWLKQVLKLNYSIYFKKFKSLILKSDESIPIPKLIETFKLKYKDFNKKIFTTEDNNLFKIRLFLEYIETTLFINIKSTDLGIIIQKLTKWVIFQRTELKKLEKNLIYDFIIYLSDNQSICSRNKSFKLIKFEEKLEMFKLLTWTFDKRELHWSLCTKG